MAGEDFADMEAFGEAKHTQLKGFLELENGIPSHDTFGRVFALLDSRAFEQCLGRWVKQKSNSRPAKSLQ